MWFKVSGFPELLPEQKIIEEKILKIISENYKKLGYTSIETPAVEKNEVLTAKWGDEVWKQIFWLYGLSQWCEDTKTYSLHFDLTVPFARYVLDHKNELTFPFKRSQIQKVWRWERAQKWRFREFYQADIDVIWDDRWNENKSIFLFYDAEVIFLLKNTLEKIFKELNLNKSFQVNINHKNIISWYIWDYLWCEDKLIQITTIIDKKDKISKEEFIKELENIWLDSEKIDKILYFSNLENIEELENINSEKLQSWLEDVKTIVNYLKKLWTNVKINLGIMRGLDYYTWIVFETFIEWERKLGSIASGGRYEKLTSFIDPKTSFSGVGGSIWVSRLQSYIFEKIELNQKTSSEYMLVNFASTQDDILNLYKKLLENAINIELYPKDDKLWKQFKYADKKGIKYVIILWEDEKQKWIFQVKNMESGEIKEYNLDLEQENLIC